MPNDAAHCLGQLRFYPAFGAAGDVTQGITFKSGNGLNWRKRWLKQCPSLGQRAKKFALPENRGLALSIGCKREFAVLCHTYVLCLLSQNSSQMPFGGSQ
jgi:hypothetical protein